MIATELRPTRTETRRAGAAARLPIQDAIQALIDGDVERVRELAYRVVLQTESRSAAIADLLYPAQLEVGNLWYLGDATSADELRAAAVVEEVVDWLPPTPTANPVPRGFRCVVATPHGDPHTLGRKMLSAALQDEGWTLGVLEPDAHWADVIRCAAELRARLVCISAAAPTGTSPLAQVIETLHQRGVRVLVGGVVFNRQPGLWRQVRADAIGPDVRIGTVLARRLGVR